MKDVKEKACGCVIFEIGPPLRCVKHQTKLVKQTTRQQAFEKKSLRSVVMQQALDRGHDLTVFKEYASQRGKWTAHCHRCGALAIVYDDVPERGDQVNADGIFVTCRKSDLIDVLGAADRDAILARFEGGSRE